MTNPETGYEKAHRQVEQIFRQFFPARGMVTREGQIRLCHTMLDALFGRDVALCDAGVGLGKTYAYLVACVLWQLQRPRQMQRPVVISTASVALQNAILTEYIPFLSNVLIQSGYIQKPICAVLRKGKERFACDRRLLIRQKQIGIRGERFRRRAAALRAANQCLDLDLLPGISRHDRRLICVPERCSRSCILHADCRYRQYLKDSNGASVTIQVCNHNYLLADAAHRQNGWKSLLKDYQALVIDEAHKLPETVRQMNTRRIRSSDLLHFEKILTTSHCTLGAQKLRGARMAFLTAFAPTENESEREKSFCLTDERSATLQHLDKAMREIFKLENKEVPPVLRNKLSDVQELIPLFLRSDTTFVRYVEYHQENGALAIDLCAVPFDLPQCVYTGYLITKDVTSPYMPELQIIDQELFDQAQEIVTQRKTKNAEWRNIPRQNGNGALLGGNLYCATCGRRMTSSNPGKGAKRDKAEYICYMGANHRNNCNGQRSYVAKRVEDIVLQATRLLLDTIKDTPRDESVEARVQAEMKELKYELRKTQQQVEEAAKEQEGLEMEVSRCLLGKSNFTTAMLSRLIDDKARERRELENKALDLERRVKNETEMSEKVAEYYNRFLGWSMEFGLATIERKRIIISQLYKRIELGRGYVVNFEVDWNYKQFIDTLELEQHMGITEVGIPMPPKVRKRSTQNSNRKNNGAA